MLEPFFPGVNPQALIAAAERYHRLKIWKSTPVIDEKAIEKFQDILVQGDVLDAGQAREVQGPGAHRVRQQGEVIRAAAIAAKPAAPASPKVELRDVNLRYFGLEGETEALKGISLSVAAGRVRRHHRAERLRQEHAAVADLRHPRADRRRRAGRRQAGRRADPQGRLHAAAGLPVRVAHHPRERRARRRDPGRRHDQGARSARRRCSPATGSASSCTICRASSRAACASGSRSRARSAPSPTWCCSTSRSRRSTRRRGWRSPTR